jgi:hypothetical protein
MTQLNPFAIGEQKPRQRLTVAGLEKHHAADPVISPIAAPGQGPPARHGRALPCLTANTHVLKQR